MFAEYFLQWLLLFSHEILMINTYFFVLLNVLNAIAKSREINWRIEITKTCGSRYYKDKVASWEFHNYRS